MGGVVWRHVACACAELSECGGCGTYGTQGDVCGWYAVPTCSISIVTSKPKAVKAEENTLEYIIITCTWQDSAWSVWEVWTMMVGLVRDRRYGQVR